jgi:hypothetical protein
MLLATDLITREERVQIREAVPDYDDVRWLQVDVLRAVNYGVIDMIDAALGEGHGRAVLVTTHEGIDRLLGATLDLMESCAAERYFARTEPVDPLGLGEPIDGPGKARMRGRLARIPLEGAVLRLAAAGNDLVNAHLLLAWEANCTSAAELRRFDLDPEDADKHRWTTVEIARRKLPALKAQPLSLLPAMWLTRELELLLGDDAVRETREWRDAIAHRERFGTSESPAFGRRSLWESHEFSVEVPKLDLTDESVPTLHARRQRLIAAAGAVLRYATSLWQVERQFFDSIGVFIHTARAEGRVQVQVQQDGTSLAPPREQRDPGSMLQAPPPWTL